MNSGDPDLQPLLLVRHGPIAAESGRCWGWTDLPLEHGRDFDSALEGVRIPHHSLIVSSDLARARDSAQILAQRNPHARLGEPASDLRELHFGLWEGLLWKEIEQRHPELYAHYMTQWRTTKTPEGESWTDLKARCRNWLDRAPRDPAALVVVAHQGSLRALWALLGGEAGLQMDRANDDEQLDQQAMGQRWGYGEAMTLWRRRARADQSP